MGNVVSWFENLFSKKNANIAMVGLDAAGKTTILDQLKLNTVRDTVPTIGFNVETVEYGSVTFQVWDIGGQQRLRFLWKHYYEGVNAVIFVIDSNDRARMKDVMAELQSMLKEPHLSEAALLVLCNKQDLPHHMTPAEIVEALGFRRSGANDLGPLLAGKKWFVQGCCAHNGQGLFEGLDWLCTHLPEG